jgi:NAD(P)-dependent dehydrogenase (short-subunit alcohol dehydrogenase family)
MEMKNVLVTGASGALGTSLVELLERYRYKVVKMGKSTKNQVVCDFSSIPELEVAIQDLKRFDFDTAILCHASPEEILNFQHLEDSLEYAQQYFKINFLSTLFLIESLSEMKVKNFYIILGAGIGGKPLSNSVLYAPMKASLAILVETIAPRLHLKGARIFGISPGRIVGGISLKLLNLPHYKTYPDLRADALEVETQGSEPSQVAERVIELIQKLEVLNQDYSGRIFSATHDRALLDPGLEIGPDHFRLRRIFV